MRLNRNTLIFLVVLVLVIAGILIYQNRPEPVDETTITSTSDIVALFEGVTVDSLTNVAYTLRQAASDVDAEPTVDTLVLSKGESEIWAIAEGSTITGERPLIQSSVVSALTALVDLRSNEQFTTEDLSAFGLDNPAVEVNFTVGETAYRLRVGNKNPAGTNYYVLLNEDNSTVYLTTSVSNTDTAINLVKTVPFETEPTPTPEPILNLPGPVFTNFPMQDITGLTITDNSTTSTFFAELSLEDLSWLIHSASEEANGREVDNTRLTIAVSDFANLNAVDGLNVSDLAPLGLDAPAYTLVASSASHEYRLQIGGKDVTGTRYYALVDDFTQVAVIPTEQVDFLLSLLTEAPYLPLPEVTPEATEGAEMTVEATPDAEITVEAESTEAP